MSRHHRDAPHPISKQASKVGGQRVNFNVLHGTWQSKREPGLKADDPDSDSESDSPKHPGYTSRRVKAHCYVSPAWSYQERSTETATSWARAEIMRSSGWQKKNRESELPLEDQRQIQLDREKYSSNDSTTLKVAKLGSLLRDPVAFKALKTLEKGETTQCFLDMYEATLRLNGKLKGYKTVVELCKVVTEVIKRKENKTMSGIRYPSHYLNFAILMRSYGGNSSKQFGILKLLLPNPETTFQNPFLIFENMPRVKGLGDSMHYSGPVAVAGDCTKVRKRLTFSNDFGGHILESVWSLTIAENTDDIKRVIGEVTKAKATQVRAILVKVILSCAFANLPFQSGSKFRSPRSHPK
ncbi:hypothetical protein B0H14DRAFT_3885850 [Mycena olivaceomarginata]|nr:hypothetical protein B0H14DRAFT_3885850 [Mycena olivaceomarginata]